MLLSWVRPFLTFPRKKLYLCLFLLLIRQVVCDSFATPWTVACQAPLTVISQARILEWVTISFSRVSSQPRDQILVSCMAGGFFTSEPSGKPHLPLLYPSEQISILPFWVCFESKHIKMHLISGIQHCALTLGNCFPKFVDILLKSIKSVFGEDI